MSSSSPLAAATEAALGKLTLDEDSSSSRKPNSVSAVAAAAAAAASTTAGPSGRHERPMKEPFLTSHLRAGKWMICVAAAALDRSSRQRPLFAH
jgi:hypothetical protein